jgi:putative ABC transport system substrate-binding protein
MSCRWCSIVQERPDALIVLLDTLTVDTRHEIAEFTAKNQLPALYSGPMFAEAGGLLVYTVDFHELWRRAAVYLDRILKGAKPAELPIEQPTKFELTINLKTARALGLVAPPSLLARCRHCLSVLNDGVSADPLLLLAHKRSTSCVRKCLKFGVDRT